MTTLIERTEGRYEVQEVSYGEAYVWCPGRVVVECDCGRKVVLTASQAVCECGADHAFLVKQSVKTSEETSHPLEAEYREWRDRQGEYVISEETYWLELRDLDRADD